MKFRTFLYTLASVVIVLLLLGAGGAYWLTSRSAEPLPPPRPSPEAAMFVSKQAPAMVSLLVNPDRLTAAELAKAPLQNRRQMEAEIRQIRQTLLAGSRVNYWRDIRPWLGNEITAAITTTDIDRDRNNGEQAGYLLAIATQDPSQSSDFLRRFWQKRRSVDVVTETYSGVPITYRQAVPSVATALVGDFVLFANSSKVLREAINTVQVSDRSLSSSLLYQEALDQRRADHPIGLAVIHPSVVGGMEPSATQSLNAEAAWLLAFEALPDGWLSHATLLAEESLEQTVPQTGDQNAEEALYPVLPASSRWAAVGTDLSQFWASWPAQATELRSLLALPTWPMDMTLDWVTGTYGVAALPRTGSALDWVLVTAQTEAAANMEQLEAIARTQGISIGSITLDGQPISVWTALSTQRSGSIPSLQSSVLAVHTTVGESEIFATSLEALQQAIQALSTSTADGKQPIQRAIAHLNSKGYLYLSQASLQTLLRQVPPVIRTTLAPLLPRLQSITLSRKSEGAGEIFIQLADL